MLTAEQLRGARGMLRIDQRQLAERSGVSVETIERLESKTGTLSAITSTVQKLRRALEAAGVEFTNGGQPGLRIKSSISAMPPDHARRARGVAQARQMADHAIDRHFERAPETEDIKGRRRRALTEMPKKLGTRKPAK